jgi:hypothetical protein
MTSGVIAAMISRSHLVDEGPDVSESHIAGGVVNNLALVPLPCDLMIGLGAIGACNGIGNMGGKYIVVRGGDGGSVISRDRA